MPLTGSDTGMQQQYLVSPTKEIDDMWAMAAIQQKRSAIFRYKQDIEDLTKGRILELTAKIKMLELEIASLENKLRSSQAVETQSVEPEANQPQGG